MSNVYTRSGSYL